MKVAKVKSSKQRARLAGRIAEWEKISASDKTGKSGRLSFIKPGSNKH